MTCSRCGHPSPPSAKFCPECGQPLATRAGAALARTPAYLAEKMLSTRGTVEGEWKVVTVLFADVRGSLELLVDHDPEEARALLDPVLQRMIEAVHRYEGTVNHILGDGTPRSAPARIWRPFPHPGFARVRREEGRS